MNWTGKLASIFVRNGNLSLILVIAFFVWGLISFFATPKQYNPKITAPSFEIIIDYPGADRNEVVEVVTKPLENIVTDIAGVEDVFSYSVKGGRAVFTVNFYVGEDPDSAKIMLDDRIRSHMHRIPVGVNDPLIRSIDPDDVPVMTIAVTSKDHDPVTLRKFGFKLRDRLSTVEGASNIGVIGGRRKELAIVVNPFKLERIGIGLMDIQNALARDNIYLPSGYIKGKSEYIPLEASSLVQKPSDLENSVVVTGDYGQILLKEVADIQERIEEVEEYVRHTVKKDGRIETAESVVLLSIAKMKGRNITEVTDRIRNELKHLESGFIPEGISTNIIVNEGRVAADEIGGLVINLFTAILIVVIILFLFLNRRAAFLVAVSIPLTLACVFIIGLFAGQNINRITLFALILSLGLLVDSATVVIENIVRNLKDQDDEQSRIDSIISSVNEVGPGLFMSTVTTVLAFFPMAFVTGMMGPYMGPIPFFVPAAIIVSLLLSLSINPWMASAVLKSESSDSKKIKIRDNRYTKALSDAGGAVFDFYRNFLHSLLTQSKKRKRTLLVILALIIISLLLPAVKLVKFRMLPKADREQFFLYIDMPAGTPLEETLDVAAKCEKYLLENEDVKMIQSYVGTPPVLDFNGLFRNVSARTESHQATLRVGLSEPDERDLKSEEIVENIRPGLLEASGMMSRKKIKLKLVEDPPGPPVLSTFLVRVRGYDEKCCLNIAKDLYGHVKKIEGVVDTDTSIEDDTDTIHLKIDHKRAFMSRISAKRIVRSINTAFSGDIIGIYHNRDNIEQEYITLRFDRKFRMDPAILEKIYLFNDLRIKLRLSDLVTIEKIPTEKALRRENSVNTIYLYGDMEKRSVTYAAIDLLKFLYNYRLPDGKGELAKFSLFGADYKTSDGRSVSISIGGEWELTLEVFRDLGIAMALAVFLIYMVLVAQFRSYTDPLIIMSTIPLSLVGVMPGFMILGYTSGIYFNATSMIGVIALAGIAVNNSIILLEYLNSFKNSCISIEDALLKAGLTRFRPIMLTTVTTMLGSLTIAGDPVWAGLAYALILGLGVSSALTLIVFPALYYVINGKKWDMRMHSAEGVKQDC